MRTKLTAFLMILCLLMVFAAVVQAAPAGKVTNMEGRADLTAPGQPARALLIGNTVNVGDILRTKSGSKLEVTWIDGSIARLSENSRLKVTEFSLGTQKRSTILSLFRGKVQNIVTNVTKLFGKKGGSRYEVHTPTSVCGVRGTKFFVYHQGGVSGALFAEGKGYGYSKGRPDAVKEITPGRIMIVESSNKPARLRDASSGELNKFMEDTTLSGKNKDGEDNEGNGTSGSGDPTTMLGGDPTATFRTTADTFGTTGPPTTYPTTPVVVPVVEPESGTTFTLPISLGSLSGTLTGSILEGTLGLTATGTPTTSASTLTGTLSDGSSYNAYLAGIPGSWQGLFTGLTYKEGVSSLLQGSLSDPNYTEGGSSISATGTITHSPGYNVSGSLITDIYYDTLIAPSYFVSTGTPSYSGQGYATSTGGLIASWSLTRTGGEAQFQEEPLTLPFLYGEYQPYSYAYLYNDLYQTDDGNGHFQIDGDMFFMNDRYYGYFTMNTRAVRTSENPEELDTFDEIGTGTYNLFPLKYYGDWGTSGSGPGGPGPGSLYYNYGGTMTLAGHEDAIFGGLTSAPWAGSTGFTAIGGYNYGYDEELQDYIYSDAYTYHLWNTGLKGYDPSYSADISGGYFKGVTAGIWSLGKKGSIRAIYVTPATGGVSTAGILASDDILITTLDSDIGMWMAEGNLGPYSGLTYPGDPANWSIESGVSSPSHTTKLKGSFTSGSPGSYINGNGTISTTFLKDNSASPPWGIYNLMLWGPNTFSGKPDTGDAAWSATLGGGGKFGVSSGDSGYWLASVTGGNWTADGQITGSVSGTYITLTHQGTIVPSPFYGVNSSQGSWIGESIGIYSGTPLAFSASVDWGSAGYFDTVLGTPQMVYDDDGTYLKGIIGSTTSFIGAAAPLTGIGTYNTASASPLLEMNISHKLNVPEQADSMSIWFGGSKDATAFTGSMAGLYAKWNGTNYNVGYLGSYTVVNGNLYSGIGMWEITSGSLTSVANGTLPGTGESYDVTPAIYSTETPRAGVIDETGIDGFSNTYEMYFGTSATQPTWGIWRAESGGTYTPGEEENTYSISYPNISSPTGVDYVSTTWDGADTIRSGSQLLARVNYGEGATAIAGGDIKGLFTPGDEVPSTWQAVSQGAFMETSAFITKVASMGEAEKAAFMAAMKIPAINVGQVTLTGSAGNEGSSLSVTMPNVNFYAYATGETPRIFATNQVNGSYDVSVGGLPPAVVNMTASNMTNFSAATAKFTPTVWNTNTSTWGATVTGGGTMISPSSTTIGFAGGAAGALTPTDPEVPVIGSFSGTAAGVVAIAPSGS